MTIEKFNEQLSEIKKGASIADIHISPDFQCDTTDGFPTSLCVHWDKGKAWLELKESLIDDESAVKNARQMCANYGIPQCSICRQRHRRCASPYT